MARIALSFIIIGFIIGYLLISMVVEPDSPKRDLQKGTAVRSGSGPVASDGAAGVSAQSNETTNSSSVTLTIRFQPFDNAVGLIHTRFGNDPIPDPAEEPWNKEGFFVLKVDAVTSSGNPIYATWLVVDAISFMADKDTNPVHELDITLPYTPGMRVTFAEPSGGRIYLRTVVP